jgi:hypothetical protein
VAKAAVASHRAATNKLDVVALGDMPALVEVDRDLPGTGVGVAAISRMKPGVSAGDTSRAEWNSSTEGVFLDASCCTSTHNEMEELPIETCIRIAVNERQPRSTYSTARPVTYPSPRLPSRPGLFLKTINQVLPPRPVSLPEGCVGRLSIACTQRQ